MSILLAMLLGLTEGQTEDRPSVLVVVGASGSAEYGAEFLRWASHWQDAARQASADYLLIGGTEEAGTPDRERLRTALAERASPGPEPLWIVLIGHGTFDGRESKFNLRGPDLTDADLLEWLRPVERPVAILNCASASGPFLPRLSAPNRVVVTATRSGDEQNFARFGQYLAESIANPHSDLDKDGQVSLLEAYLVASSQVGEFYRSRSRLATEHALIDDSGDRLGTPADWFRGIHATKRAKEGAEVDGIRAHQLHLVLNDRERRMPSEQRRRRDQLERDAAALRGKKDELPEDEYYARLEAIMSELARLYQSVPGPVAVPGRSTGRE